MNIHSDLLHAKRYFNCLMLLLVTECSVKSNLGFGNELVHLRVIWISNASRLISKCMAYQNVYDFITSISQTVETWEKNPICNINLNSNKKKSTHIMHDIGTRICKQSSISYKQIWKYLSKLFEDVYIQYLLRRLISPDKSCKASIIAT